MRILKGFHSQKQVSLTLLVQLNQDSFLLEFLSKDRDRYPPLPVSSDILIVKLADEVKKIQG
jgi:hypothetical protein